MSSPPFEIGPVAFAHARRTAREAARREARGVAVAALQEARDRFAEHAAAVYDAGVAAALGDCDTLEDIADRLVGVVAELEPTVDRLDVARDLAAFHGPVLRRTRSRYDPARLAVLVAEALAEDLLSGEAAAVLAAAVRCRSL